MGVGNVLTLITTMPTLTTSCCLVNPSATLSNARKRGVRNDAWEAIYFDIRVEFWKLILVLVYLVHLLHISERASSASSALASLSIAISVISKS